MEDNLAISLEHVSKKYCKLLSPSMWYGLKDIGRNVFGLSSRPQVLRRHEFWAVDDVSFDVIKGETFGVIGPNGSGKTTLLKMLNGIFWPDKGKITLKGTVGALIAVGAGFHPQLTGRENVYIQAAILGMGKKQVDAEFDSIIEFADIGDFIETPVKLYSSGMFVRLGFAVAVHAEPEILLVDEVLAVGDEGFQAKCHNKIGELREAGTTAVLVSHNMHTISGFADRAVLLQNGRATRYDDIEQAVQAYTALFFNRDDTCGSQVEVLCDGNSTLSFYDARIEKTTVQPGDDIDFSVEYTATKEYKDVEIDTVLRSSSERGRYFQATNKAYDKVVNFPSGTHTFRIRVEGVPINNTTGRFAVAIWTKGHKDMLFWCKISIEFAEKRHTHGKNFLNVSYEIQS